MQHGRNNRPDVAERCRREAHNDEYQAKRKFWLMTARVLRESFTRNGSRRKSLFMRAMVAL